MSEEPAVVRFWGVRGSIPAPDASGVRYGGNTSCVSVEWGSGKVLVLDAGTGIRHLGKALEHAASEIFVLLTHSHFDHVQGFPFFRPIYQPDRTIHVFPAVRGKRVICSLLDQMDGAYFPLKAEDLPSRYQCVTRRPMAFLRAAGFAISRVRTNHPGGGYGYRLEHGGRALVYLTDNELDPPAQQRVTEFNGFVRFCRGADILIHDAQYLDEDMPAKHGWGHSLARQACELAAASGARQLVLFHHDPDRTDDEIDRIQEDARAWLRKRGHRVDCVAAFEGLKIEM